MLKTQEILDKLNIEEREQYKDMIAAVNIPDFYKCIAQLSGLQISKVNDNAIFSYLHTWCRNKYKYFKMLGNKTRLDQKFIYNRPLTDLSNQILELGKQYPAYYLWLKEFRGQKKNKIEIDRWNNLYSYCKDIFPQYNINGTTMTHFFKSKLNAPDELVTAIGRLFENDKVEATHTISIDPVDMMLASENPYDWNSCYRLELDNSSSHADGCLAAILDTNSLITYVWSSEGKYNMYDQFKFKNIRYYRMRQWIAIANDWGAIHFNAIYPGKDDYDSNFEKMFRDIVEKVVADYMGVTNTWRKNDYICEEHQPEAYYIRSRYIYSCYRENYYGYGEYHDDYIYINSQINPQKEVLSKEEYDKLEQDKDKKIFVYNEKILCPCGCETELIGSDECGDCDEGDDWEYNGNGFVCSNFYEREQHWCDYKDDYCEYECDGYCCEGCCYWEDAHPYCEVCDMECPEGIDAPDVYDGYAHPDDTCKKTCPHWKECHHPCSLDQEITCDISDEVSTYIDDNGKEICHANECDCCDCCVWKKHNENNDAKVVD